MRYFWHFVLSISVIGVMFFIFFGASLRFGDRITYTDQEARTEPSITFVDPVLGKNDAPVTMVVFGDYACDDCAAFDETSLDLVATDFPNELRVVWKDMPNTSQHPEALGAAIAARCAGDQGKFWEFHTALMQNHTSLGSALYASLAAQLELKEKTFNTCVTEQTPAPLVQATYEEGLALGVATTPTIYLNGVRYTGSVDRSTLKVIIRQLLAQ